ncbi:MAG TPA: ATP-dependent RNA helicase HrpA, partial [Steroidobacteraceae bacterium]|nr:ATP-dependent RNA helicase HrpA [Steroidobacteraceae bacterium]
MSEPVHDVASRLAALRELIPQCALRDRRRLQSTLDRLARRPAAVDGRELARLEAQVLGSAALLESRRASVPPIRYDETLPVHARREDIARAIREHQVVIVSGATGSGKSTQLPKICLELGRGIDGLIGHTQPRRIAAQALANRISAELGTPTGDLVGYQVRFVDRTSPRTLVKLMTDGLLLRELESDPLLLRYDTLIIDEAHERNLNVDFLLGVCKRILPRRPDLRLIVTSATIETQRFSEYFDGAPVIDVEGRTYPVEVRYRPLAEEDEAAPPLPEAIRDALEELTQDSRGIRGDALVFLPGEKQILETRDLLTRSRVDWDVLPLYGRLAGPDQDKVFASHQRRRVVLATNVAETSLTIPGVRFVIDAGLARVSRYSPRAKFQRLPIEPVSQASADQRRGRCGREGEGICVRLYSEEDYLARPRYTEPEILRTNLASLVLQMAALGLGGPEDFPFLDPPDARLLNDGYRLLQELGAVDGERRITRLGRQMASLPVDPRLARILVEAARTGCLEQCLVIVAFLSIQDPRERPSDKTEAAAEKHAQFADERSDFVAVLNLWQASREPAAGGNRTLRHWCRENFLSFLRMREWADLREQLADMSQPLGKAARKQFDESEKAGRKQPAETGQSLENAGRKDAAGEVSSAVLHQTLLTGFLGGIGVLDEARTYLGARDARFVIAPGTPLQKRSPHWIVAASLVETHRLYARMVAQVQPSWIESAGAHLVRRTYDAAEWDSVRGMAFARETVTLYGRVLGSGRRVNFATVDPAAARRMFVEEALVRRRPSMPFRFLDRNEQTRSRLEFVEACLRRRDLLAADDALVAFYLARLPAEMASTRAFERWWRQEERTRPHLLDAAEDVFLVQPLPSVRREDYPATLDVHGNALQLRYRFDTTAVDDGATLDVPLPLLRALDPHRLEWLIPGWLREKVIQLLRGLPKDVRRELVPIPDAADRFLAGLEGFGVGSLNERIAAFATQAAGTVVTEADVAAIALPPWLRFNLRVLDAQGRVLHASRDLDVLHDQFRAELGATPLGAGVNEWERAGVRSWDFGDVPAEVTVRNGSLRLRAYPGLKDEEQSVRLRLFTSATVARRSTDEGLVRLAALAVPQQYDMVRRQWATDREFTLLVAAAGFGKSLLDEIADRAVAEAMFGTAGSGNDATTQGVRGRAAFDAVIDKGRAHVVDRGAEVGQIVRAVLVALKDVRAALGAMPAPAFDGTRAAVVRQIDALLAPGWVRRTPQAWWPQLPKYVRAMVRRLERARGDVERDRKLQAQVGAYEIALRRLDAAAAADMPSIERERLRWMIEEFRLSLFAQDLRTLMPVSAKRLDEQLQ